MCTVHRTLRLRYRVRGTRWVKAGARCWYGTHGGTQQPAGGGRARVPRYSAAGECTRNFYSRNFRNLATSETGSGTACPALHSRHSTTSIIRKIRIRVPCHDTRVRHNARAVDGSRRVRGDRLTGRQCRATAHVLTVELRGPAPQLPNGAAASSGGWVAARGSGCSGADGSLLASAGGSAPVRGLRHGGGVCT